VSRASLALRPFSQIVDGVALISDPDGPGLVSRDALPVADARRLERELRDAGHEASWAPDGNDRSTAWLYVTQSLAPEPYGS